MPIQEMLIEDHCKGLALLNRRFALDIPRMFPELLRFCARTTNTTNARTAKKINGRVRSGAQRAARE